MEPSGHLLGLEDGDVVRELRVERLGDPLGGRAAVGGEARNLSGGMNSRIGATGDSKTVPAPEHGIERVPERSSTVRSPGAAPSLGSPSRRTRA